MQRKNAGNDRPMQQLSAVLRKGWKEAGPELEQWLDRTFEGKWAQDLREAAAFPPGMILDPRSGTGFASRPSEATREGVRQMTMVLQARFLQHQARGDSSAALDDLAMLLAVSRTIRNHAPSAFSWDSRALELETLTQFDAWLRQVGPRPALLRRALDELNRHEAERPPLADQVKAGYLEYQNSFDNPPSWLWKQNDPAARLYRLGYQLVAFARQAPWERARIQRIADALFAGWLRAAETDYWKLEDPFIGVPVERPRAIGRFYLEGWQPASEGPAAVLGPARLAHLIDASTTFGDLYPGMWGIWGRGRKIEAEILRRLQSARLKTALALYQIDKKNPPQTLDDLVPHYLPEVPVNPLTGHNLELGDLKEGKP
jgi:hypothetical protein